MAARTCLIVFGAQGSGKGTQARMLQERLGVPQVATGDLFRTHKNQGTELGKLAQSYMERGELVPDSVTVAMVEDRLSQPDAAPGAILDGFPRNLAQAEALDAMLSKMGAKVTAAVYIQLDRDQLMKRITGRRTCRNCQAVYHVEFSPPKVAGVCDACGGEVIQRADDADEAAVARRLELYLEQTTPVIEYYRGKRLLREVDGNLSIDGVQAAILTAIKPKRAPAKPRAAKKPAALRKTKPAKKAARKPTRKAPKKKTATKVTRRKQV